MPAILQSLGRKRRARKREKPNQTTQTQLYTLHWWKEAEIFTQFVCMLVYNSGVSTSLYKFIFGA